MIPIQEVVMGKHDVSRDGQGDPQPEKWQDWIGKNEGNKREGEDSK